MKIQKLLNQKGFSVGTSEKANCYLLFEYGIDSGRTIVGSSPAYHPGGTSTINTMDNYGGMSYSNVQTPGYTTCKTHSEIIYTRRLVLKLIEGNNYRSSPKAGPLWIGEITSSGSSPDLRDVMNYMLVAAFEHFGENTQKAIREIILSGDARVKALMEP